MTDHKSIYLYRPVQSPVGALEEIRDNLKLAPKREPLHVTLVYSETFVDWENPTFAPQSKRLVIPQGTYQLKVFGDHVVLLIESDHLSGRYQDLINAGAKTAFARYTPHVTLGTLTPESLPLPETLALNKWITLGPEERDDRPQHKAAIATEAAHIENFGIPGAQIGLKIPDFGADD
jgi:hypothetical protein